jgi:mono/diheme cytochrome c family protein
LLLLNKQELLIKFTKSVKIPEIIVSVFFLGTGIGLLFMCAETSLFLWGKLVAVALSIPLAVIGFRKMNKGLAALSFVLLILAYTLAEIHRKNVNKPISETSSVGKTSEELYTLNCEKCHGPKGDKGLSGASNLATSKLTRAEKLLRIKNGKGAMPAYAALGEEQLEAIVAYIETFK